MATEEKSHYRRKIQELSLLFEISQTLDQSVDLEHVVTPLLKAIAENMGMLRGTLTLLNRQSGEIFIEAAYGLSTTQREKGKYRLGEGITGKVVQTGKAMVIPNISAEPTFLNRTGARTNLSKKDISFICVPIKLGNETIGTLSVDRLFAEDISLDEDVRLLSIISSMIARAVKLRQEIEEERQRLLEENTRLQQVLKDRYRPANIIGNSQAMQEVFDLIAHVSKSDATVLVRGESGTGKEMIARAIHRQSARRHAAFVAINCGAVPESLLESEMFGHARGAFTGAESAKEGKFEAAPRALRPDGGLRGHSPRQGPRGT